MDGRCMVVEACRVFSSRLLPPVGNCLGHLTSSTDSQPWQSIDNTIPITYHPLALSSIFLSSIFLSLLKIHGHGVHGSAKC